MEEALAQALGQLEKGQPVAFPTETVYGLGAPAKDAEAVQRVFAYKGRPSDNPLIVHVSDVSMLSEVVSSCGDMARRLMDHFWPSPLTLVLPRHSSIPDVVTAGLETVAVRMPRHDLALALIAKAGPLVAPSANLSGSPSPTTAAHVRADFGGAVMVLDGCACSIGLESTVVALRSDCVQILRPGQVGAQELAAVTGLPVYTPKTKSGETPPSPGMKYRHYAPRARVRWMGEVGPVLPAEVMALVHTRRDLRGENVVELPSLMALAQQLYARFREADTLGCTEVLVEPWRETSGLSEALRNRVEKASQG